MGTEPLPTGFIGRDGTGRFARGNRLARGNPNNRRAQQIRNSIIEAISPEGMAAAAKKLLAQAQGGDRAAFAELADRACGKPVPSSVEERVSRIEDRLGLTGADDDD